MSVEFVTRDYIKRALREQALLAPFAGPEQELSGRSILADGTVVGAYGPE